MKIIVLSDSHGNYFSLEKVMLKYDGDIYIHLGDGERELASFCMQYPDKKIYTVSGNCDPGSMSPGELVLSPDGKNVIYAVHGHAYGVKYSLKELKERAAKKGANIILYGHTHCRYNQYEDGTYIMNPGSVSAPRDGNRPSFGIIDLLPDGIITNIVDL